MSTPQMASSQPRPIIVLGAERSGTSVVAAMIACWGAYAGAPEELTPADHRNPQGYWEFKPIWDALASLGDFDQGVSWWDETFEDQLRAKLAMPRDRAMALALVARMQTTGRPWLWKDPALSFFLPFWQSIWGDAVYVITVRNPYDTARSWQQFVLPQGFTGNVSLVAGNLLRWQYILLRILTHTEPSPCKLFIAYETLLQEPEAQAQRLATFLAQHCDMPPPDAVRIAHIASAVDPALWRNHSTRPFGHTPEATNAQQALYRLLQHKVHDPYTPFDPNDYPMTPGWREFIQNEYALVKTYTQA